MRGLEGGGGGSFQRFCGIIIKCQEDWGRGGEGGAGGGAWKEKKKKVVPSEADSMITTADRTYEAPRSTLVHTGFEVAEGRRQKAKRGKWL